ncbi:MAG: hypothetical protein JNM81_03990 [Rhodospirillaceae bacterium]|nr:hypothetical protein [Rhodospirillaceae bacterium]
MTEKTTPSSLIGKRMHNPKSDDGLARSAEALRANLLKRKAQKRAQATAPDPDQVAPESDAKPDQK